LVSIFFVTHSSKNTSLKTATIWPKHVGGLRRLLCDIFTYLHMHWLVLLS